MDGARCSKQLPGRLSRRRALAAMGGLVATAWLAACGGDDESTEADPVAVASPTAVPKLYPVEQYGAAGDGVTDDAAAFQAAIDVASAEGGGIVQLSGAAYLLDAPVFVFGTGITLAGVPGSTRLIAGPGLFHTDVFTVRAGSFTARDLWFDMAPNGGHDHASRALNFRNDAAPIENILIERIRVDHAERAGIRTEGTSQPVVHGRVIDCVFNDCRAPIALDYLVEDWEISGNEIVAPWGDGGISVDLLTAPRRARRLNITGNTIVNSLVPSGGGQGAIRGRMIDSVIANNTISVGPGGFAGIRLSAGQGNRVTGNVISRIGERAGTGIEAFAEVATSIEQNEVRDFSIGLVTDDNSRNLAISGNDLVANTTPVRIAGSGHTLSNNTGVSGSS